ncbi:hypothetical protein E1A91_D02G197200v1, partial [Gossypium mustelinum]
QATVVDPSPQKINLISCGPMTHVSDIKLIRTDTTLDLSQKAEKGMLSAVQTRLFYKQLLASSRYISMMWDKDTVFSNLIIIWDKSLPSISGLGILSGILTWG